MAKVTSKSKRQPATTALRVREEHDSMGTLLVPAEALWGAQTQRALQNFKISGRPMPRDFLRALAWIKAAAAQSNAQLGLLSKRRAAAIAEAALAVATGEYDSHFPVDVFQTGSGTSSNMNMNEVVATLASNKLRAKVHPNDDVNLGQSSNDVIPTAIRVSSVCAIHERMRPALRHLRSIIDRRAREGRRRVKTGRTHLMDAMPLTVAQEFGAWSSQLASAQARIDDAVVRLQRLPIGGTAVGTGINTDPRFGKYVATHLSRQSGRRFRQAQNLFEGIAAQDDAVELSGQLNALATTLMKIANDLRWMNSGPLAGLAEIELPALQPGSSIMPGKVNPVIPEAVAMVCAQVTGLHITVTVAGQHGNFQLNTMLPLIAVSLLEAITLLTNAMRALADSAIAGLRIQDQQLQIPLARNPMLATALNPVIGYEKAAAIAKRALREQRTVLEIALEDSGLGVADLKRLLDPMALTRGGVRHRGGEGGG